MLHASHPEHPNLSLLHMKLRAAVQNHNHCNHLAIFHPLLVPQRHQTVVLDQTPNDKHHILKVEAAHSGQTSYLGNSCCLGSKTGHSQRQTTRDTCTKQRVLKCLLLLSVTALSATLVLTPSCSTCVGLLAHGEPPPVTPWALFPGSCMAPSLRSQLDLPRPARPKRTYLQRSATIWKLPFSNVLPYGVRGQDEVFQPCSF